VIGCGLRETCSGRRAFTLLEVMLTLCLLVIVAALAWPALDKPFAGMRLRKAADQIRAAWAGARVEAMNCGETYLFQYAVDEGRFRIEPASTASTQQNSAFGLASTETAPGFNSTGELRKRIEDSLPEGVTFVGGEVAADTRTAMLASQTGQSGLAEANWSDPILFHPDGTTSTARLVLKNENDRYIELRLRGLTGVVNVGEVAGNVEALR
jgi:prepilin-type N-terminal cleavage/methylation domain-containing protein